MYKRTLPLVIILFLSAVASAQDAAFDRTLLSEKGRQAFSTLTAVPVFAIGGVGYSGETSKGELALDVLIEEKAAVGAFKQLITDGTIEGGFYGVVGLKMLDCKCFDQEFLRFKELRFGGDNADKFTIQTGCTGMSSETPPQKMMMLNEISAFVFDEALRKECERSYNGNTQAIRACVASKRTANKQ